MARRRMPLSQRGSRWPVAGGQAACSNYNGLDIQVVHQSLPERSLVHGLFGRLQHRNRRRRFAEFMGSLDEVIAINKHALPSVARAIAKPLQARRLVLALQYPKHQVPVSGDFADFFFPDHLPLSADGRNLDELAPAENPPARKYRMRLGRDVLLPWAWHRANLVSTLATIGSSKSAGPWRCDINHQVRIVLPFGLGLVQGGNHSIAAGVADSEGDVWATARNLAPAYAHVDYDGVAFVRRHDARILNVPREEEPGMLFELGRRMHEHGVEYDADSTPAEHMPQEQSVGAHEVLYSVHVNGQDSGYSVRPSVLEQALQEAGIQRSDPRWRAILFSGESFRSGDAVWTFKPYGPRPMVTALDHVPRPSF